VGRKQRQKKRKREKKKKKKGESIAAVGRPVGHGDDVRDQQQPRPLDGWNSLGTTKAERKEGRGGGREGEKIEHAPFTPMIMSHPRHTTLSGALRPHSWKGGGRKKKEEGEGEGTITQGHHCFSLGNKSIVLGTSTMGPRTGGKRRGRKKEEKGEKRPSLPRDLPTSYW